MFTVRDLLVGVGWEEDNTAVVTFATDSIKKDCNIAMVCVLPITSEEMITWYVEGAAVELNSQYNNINIVDYNLKAISHEEHKKCLKTIVEENYDCFVGHNMIKFTYPLIERDFKKDCANVEVIDTLCLSKWLLPTRGSAPASGFKNPITSVTELSNKACASRSSWTLPSNSLKNVAEYLCLEKDEKDVPTCVNTAISTKKVFLELLKLPVDVVEN